MVDKLRALVAAHPKKTMMVVAFVAIAVVITVTG